MMCSLCGQEAVKICIVCGDIFCAVCSPKHLAYAQKLSNNIDIEMLVPIKEEKECPKE